MPCIRIYLFNCFLNVLLYAERPVAALIAPEKPDQGAASLAAGKSQL